MSRLDNLAVVLGADALLREGIARILSSTKYRIRASEACYAELDLSLIPDDKPILLVIAVCDEPVNPIEQIREFKHRFNSARIAVLANRQDDKTMIDAFRAGANAYFVKVSNFDTFIKALDLVMLGETIFPSGILEALSDRLFLDIAQDKGNETDPGIDTRGQAANCGAVPLEASEVQRSDVTNLDKKGIQAAPRLSARELAVLRCLAEGDSNKSIARKSNIAEATVKVHVKSILRKISVHNRTQAAIWARSHIQAGPGPHAPVYVETE